MSGERVVVKMTSTRPWKDPSIYFVFGFKQEDGSIQLVEYDVQNLPRENIVEGDYIIEFDQPCIYKPIWDKLNGKTYYPNNTSYSIVQTFPYVEGEIYRGLHSVKSI